MLLAWIRHCDAISIPPSALLAMDGKVVNMSITNAVRRGKLWTLCVFGALGACVNGRLAVPGPTLPSITAPAPSLSPAPASPPASAAPAAPTKSADGFSLSLRYDKTLCMGSGADHHLALVACNDANILRVTLIDGLLRTKDGLCLDVPGDPAQFPQEVALATCQPAAAASLQHWTYDKAGYLFLSRSDLATQCLFTAGAAVAGARLQVDACSTGATQWVLGAEGFVIMQEDGGTSCLQISNDSPQDGTAVSLAPCTGAAAQRWTFDADVLRATSLGAGQFCLDVGTDAANTSAAGVLTCTAGAVDKFFYNGADATLRLQGSPQTCLIGSAPTSDGTSRPSAAACRSGSGWILAPM